ncbi:MAG: pyrroloquinoline quinone biosynthesis peptide chaperone PqqD [Gammaproteobacteria bacterium]|nr:MAG: pyrroloquinoline quinone biosynthesis peptide chaperone PqqD [Gammaproteobacteria bacterium]
MMEHAFQPGQKPSIRSGFRFQWEPAQERHVLLYPEGMVKLTASAGEILKRCDGEHTVAEIVEELKQQFPGVDLEADVYKFLEVADENGWIEVR